MFDRLPEPFRVRASLEYISPLDVHGATDTTEPRIKRWMFDPIASTWMISRVIKKTPTEHRVAILSTLKRRPKVFVVAVGIVDEEVRNKVNAAVDKYIKDNESRGMFYTRSNALIHFGVGFDPNTEPGWCVISEDLYSMDAAAKRCAWLMDAIKGAFEDNEIYRTISAEGERLRTCVGPDGDQVLHIGDIVVCKSKNRHGRGIYWKVVGEEYDPPERPGLSRPLGAREYNIVLAIAFSATGEPAELKRISRRTLHTVHRVELPEMCGARARLDQMISSFMARKL